MTVSLNTQFHIFRDSRRQLTAAELVANVRSFLSQLASRPKLEELIHGLLLAAELECALSDATAGADDLLAAQRVTSIFAEAAVAVDASANSTDGAFLSQNVLRLLERVNFPGQVSVSVPEGFAYYALHPLDYADLIERVGLETARVFVVGIRSIGTTLSAVLCAKLSQLGVHAERLTVRPTGHPYERHCELDSVERQLIARARSSGAAFVVCDEGPGRSGSSLLSVAEALEREYVPSSRILILCSHEPDVNALCAPDASQRWRRYRSLATGMTRRLPVAAKEYAGGGEWRRHVVSRSESYPAIWPQMERLRFLSACRRALYTFEGHGPYGAAVRSRNEGLSDSKFGLGYLGHEYGFGKHNLPDGRPHTPCKLTAELLSRMAEYCAWRAQAFGVSAVQPAELEAMTRGNFEREFGELPDNVQLRVERATICDNCMGPQYWVTTGDDPVSKLDAAIHGDNHFFPGPCDIAWDLAGVIVEWSVDASAREFFLQRYRRVSGDDASSRIGGYELGYATFRMAWSKMAAASVAGSEDEQRLMRDYRRYRGNVQNLVSRPTRVACY